VVPVGDQQAHSPDYLVAAHIVDHHFRDDADYRNQWVSFVVETGQTLNLKTTLREEFALVLQNRNLMLRL
jgi:hypothetical protein